MIYRKSMKPSMISITLHYVLLIIKIISNNKSIDSFIIWFNIDGLPALSIDLSTRFGLRWYSWNMWSMQTIWAVYPTHLYSPFLLTYLMSEYTLYIFLGYILNAHRPSCWQCTCQLDFYGRAGLKIKLQQAVGRGERRERRGEGREERVGGGSGRSRGCTWIMQMLRSEDAASATPTQAVLPSVPVLLLLLLQLGLMRHNSHTHTHRGTELYIVYICIGSNMTRRHSLSRLSTASVFIVTNL